MNEKVLLFVVINHFGIIIILIILEEEELDLPFLEKVIGSLFCFMNLAQFILPLCKHTWIHLKCFHSLCWGARDKASTQVTVTLVTSLFMPVGSKQCNCKPSYPLLSSFTPKLLERYNSVQDCMESHLIFCADALWC